MGWFKETRKPRGRPQGTNRKDPAEIAQYHTLLSRRTRDIVEMEKRPNETYDEALYRLIVEKNFRIKNLQKKVDALELRIALNNTPIDHLCIVSRSH